VRYRPTLLLWFIVLAPFVTFIAVTNGWLAGLWVMFISHLSLLAVTLIPSSQGFGPVITQFETNTGEVWLTIDDGPHPDTTPKALALLEQYDARATFFLIGERITRYPDLAQAIAEAGHTIGNHTQRHQKFHFWRLGPKQLVREIDDFAVTAARAGLPVSDLFRAPAGMKNPFLHPILAARDLHLIGWSLRAYDTQLRDPDEIVERITRSLSPGCIILLHEGDCADVRLRALEALLQELAKRNFRVVSTPPERLMAGKIPITRAELIDESAPSIAA
jgi:peptidoglycan/xylan/chitin deacetylase (PgdA/CDA1 family)